MSLWFLVLKRRESQELMHIITSLSSHTELPFPHGMLIRLFPAIDYKNESQVYNDKARALQVIAYAPCNVFHEDPIHTYVSSLASIAYALHTISEQNNI